MNINSYTKTINPCFWGFFCLFVCFVVVGVYLGGGGGGGYTSFFIIITIIIFVLFFHVLY